MERYTELLTKRSTQRADTPIRAMSHADMTAQMDIYDGAITAVEEGTGGPISHCPSCGIERYFKHPGPTDTSNPMIMLCSIKAIKDEQIPSLTSLQIGFSNKQEKAKQAPRLKFGQRSLII